jgi:hypothetical protein
MKTKGVAKKFVIVALSAACVGFVISLSFGYANHSPKPHDVRIDAVGPAAAAARIQAGVDHDSPGGFIVTRVSSMSTARNQVLDQNVGGALIVPRAGATTILTAAAAGPTLQQTVVSALEASSRAIGRSSAVHDLVPLPNADRSGLTSYVFELGLLIASIIVSVGLFLVGRNDRIWYRVAAACGFVLLVSAADVIAQYAILGSFSTAPLASYGIAIFGGASFVLFVAACQAVFGFSGTVVGAVVFIFVGNFVTGGAVPRSFLPDVYRQLSNWMPDSAIVSSVRSVVYFGGRSLGHPLLVLSVWTGVSLILVAAVDALQAREIRQTSTPPREVYAASALVLLRNRRHRRESATTGAELASPS